MTSSQDHLLPLEKDDQTGRGILLIYTGGTIGSAPQDPMDPHSPQIVMPWRDLKTSIPGLDRLGYPIDAISFAEPLNSCDIEPYHWQWMADIIAQRYDDYEGFVILHGTDTLAYTASMLSFMLGHLGKPVVVTGAQIGGVSFVRNDAHQNLLTAAMLAHPKAHGLKCIPEVMVCFGGRILRGNRTRKVDSFRFQGFDSPDLPWLGECGERIVLRPVYSLPIPSEPLRVRTEVERDVIMLEMFPGIQRAKILEAILSQQAPKGIVLRSFGAGNIPTEKGFLSTIQAYLGDGGVVVNVTGVGRGGVNMGLYDTNQQLLDLGIWSGFDMTPEAAMCKLMWLLGQEHDDVQEIFQSSLVGELSM
tara:strand:- start:828 stop:1907 length:1080 start_codon:yes stop_codon:yes gene_type:complete